MDKLTNVETRHYIRFYPNYTQASVKKVLQKVKDKYGKLDAVTVDHYIKDRRFGGLGLGKRKKSAK